MGIHIRVVEFGALQTFMGDPNSVGASMGIHIRVVECGALQTFMGDPNSAMGIHIRVVECGALQTGMGSQNNMGESMGIHQNGGMWSFTDGRTLPQQCIGGINWNPYQSGGMWALRTGVRYPNSVGHQWESIRVVRCGVRLHQLQSSAG